MMGPNHSSYNEHHGLTQRDDGPMTAVLKRTIYLMRTIDKFLFCFLSLSTTLSADAALNLSLPASVVDPGFESRQQNWLAMNDGQPGTEAPKQPAEDAGAPQPSAKELGDALANPLSYLWLLFMQNDTQWFTGDLLDELGEDHEVVNTTVLQPVMSMQLTEDWKVILRPVLPIVSAPTLSCNAEPGFPADCLLPANLDISRKTGIGDMVLWTAFSNAYKPPNIFGFGPTIMLDTASDDKLGTGKWSIGPMALAFHVGEKWIYGAVIQQWWSFAGDDDREDVSLMDLQYVLRYRVSPTTNIGFGPNIRANWKADKKNRWTVPIGIGGDVLVKAGPLPMKIGAELYYYVEKPDDFGPEWQLRIMISPVLPAPAWSRTPLF